MSLDILIKDSIKLTGYNVKIEERKSFWVCGYTKLIPKETPNAIPNYYDELIQDGRMEKLKKSINETSWIFGMGSYDPECKGYDHRYTICVEMSNIVDKDFLNDETLFKKEIDASSWLKFENPYQEGKNFWKDDPYKMLNILGYKFHSGSFGSGMHFDVYPVEGFNQYSEFWITVIK